MAAVDARSARGPSVVAVEPIDAVEANTKISASVADARVVNAAVIKPVRRRGGFRILLAEDNPVNQRVAMVMLRKLGHQVSVVDDGEQAVARAEAETFDLALMDVQMPHLDGLEASARIRARAAQAGKPRLPIIAMTAHAMKGDRERCLEAGMDDYMSKPIRLAELAAVLDRVMARVSSSSSDASAAAAADAAADAASKVMLRSPEPRRARHGRRLPYNRHRMFTFRAGAAVVAAVGLGFVFGLAPAIAAQASVQSSPTPRVSIRVIRGAARAASHARRAAGDVGRAVFTRRARSRARAGGAAAAD